MDIIRLLYYKSTFDDWKDGFLWLFWALLLGLLPLWGALLGYKLFSQEITSMSLTQGGDFTLYIASFISSSLYLIIRDSTEDRFPSFKMLISILVAILLFASFMYAAIAVVDIINSANDKQVIADIVKSADDKGKILGIINSVDDNKTVFLNNGFVNIVSWIILPLTIFVSLLITVAENIRLEVNVENSRKFDAGKLNDDFDSLGDDDE